MIDDRRSSFHRGYDAAWSRLRKLKLRSNPLCEDCNHIDRLTRATMVHHIVTIEADPTLRLAWDNLMSLCEACHDVRHSGEAHQVKGCDVNGLPTHPGHPWARAGKAHG